LIPGRRKKTGPDIGQSERRAHELARRMPALLVEASRIASTLSHGIHGRRRRGPGETFWQYRPYESTDAAASIDWRRSATSDRLFVREREWEAAQTIWLWPDLSASMNFSSSSRLPLKSERALLLALALGDLLARAGERIALPGLMPPTARHDAMHIMARSIITHQQEAALDHLAIDGRMAAGAEIIWLSDFLDPPEETGEIIRALSLRGLSGHLIQLCDPAEESLPYKGRVLFEDMESSQLWLAGESADIREEYKRRYDAQRQAIRQLARRQHFSFTIHHTSRPASEALLALYARLGAGDGRKSEGLPGMAAGAGRAAP